MASLIGAPQPSRSANDLGRFIANSTDVQRRILVETVESAAAGHILESGRTICPQNADQIRGPLGRFPRAVDLQSCPSGAAGIMHTHVSADQLRAPTHSLPDIANVIFGDVDASMVVGTERSDMLLGPDDRELAVAAFQDALGLDVQSPRDLVASIKAGQIPNPTEARNRVRTRLAPLFRTINTRHDDLARSVQEMEAAGTIPAHRPVIATCHTHSSGSGYRAHGHGVGGTCAGMRERKQRAAAALARQGDSVSINLMDIAIATSVSTVISTYVSRKL